MEETREVIQDRMICGLATILPIDKFVCMKAYIEHLSDAEFNRFAEEMKGYAKENCSIKEYAELQLAARKAYGVTSDNSALNILYHLYNCNATIQDTPKSKDIPRSPA